MEPYIDALGKFADEKDNPHRQGILAMLASLIPTPPDKAIAYLDANLENSANTTEETLDIIACLLQTSKTGFSYWAPADPATVHRVVTFVSSDPNVNLTSNVLHEIGLYAIQVPEAITSSPQTSTKMTGSSAQRL